MVKVPENQIISGGHVGNKQLFCEMWGWGIKSVVI